MGFTSAHIWQGLPFELDQFGSEYVGNQAPVAILGIFENEMERDWSIEECQVAKEWNSIFKSRDHNRPKMAHHHQKKDHKSWTPRQSHSHGGCLFLFALTNRGCIFMTSFWWPIEKPSIGSHERGSIKRLQYVRTSKHRAVWENCAKSADVTHMDLFVFSFADDDDSELDIFKTSKIS